MEKIDLDLLPKDGERIVGELEAGNMVAARSRNDFLYIIERDGQFHMFSHTSGAPGGGKRQFPKNEKYTAAVRKLADVSDSVYLVSFDAGYDIYGVMYSAEEGILAMFPGDDRDGDAVVDFGIPDPETGG
ncbi:MAG: hypothetical protein LBJ99_04380 [Oscillospiraceae bacterium]|jgi:hypothetical protein|nr:hypothetical protein [Oscillospiraceae bacterium]